MKNVKNFFPKIQGLILFALLLIIANCKKKGTDDNPVSETTVAEDKVFLSNSVNSVYSCISDLHNGSLANLFYSFTGMTNGDMNNDDWIGDMIDSLDNVKDLSIIEGFNFSMPFYQGIYNYSAGSWTTSALSGQVQANFPSSPSSGTNDCRLTITQAAMSGQYVVDNDTFHLPQNLSYSIARNGSTLSTMNITGSYTANSSGFPLPQVVNINYHLEPFDYSINVSQNNSTSYQLDYGMQTGGSCQMDIHADLTFANDDFENFEISEDLTAVAFTVTRGDLRIEGTWNAQAYYAISNPTASQINSTIDFKVFHQSQKIGDLRFVDNGNGNELYIFYKDGTSENTSVYHDPFTDDLDALLLAKWGHIK